MYKEKKSKSESLKSIKWQYIHGNAEIEVRNVYLSLG